MEEKEIKIILNLLERERSMYKDVYERTKREFWLSKIEELDNIKNKLIDENITK